MIRYITLFCSLLFSTIVVAQNDSLYHNIAQMAIEQLNIYQSSSSFSRESKIDTYYDLFENSQVQVVNDILHLNEANSSISLREYIKLIRENYKRLNVSISINEIGEIDFSSVSSGKFDVYVTKEINSENISRDYEITINDLNEEYDERISYSKKVDLVFKFYFNKEKIEIIEISNDKKVNPTVIITPKIKYSIFSKKYNTEDLKVLINSDTLLMQGLFHSLNLNKSNTSIEPVHKLLFGKMKVKRNEVLQSRNKVHELVFRKSSIEFSNSFIYNFSPIRISSESIHLNLENDFSYSIKSSLRFNLTNILRSKTKFNSIVIDGKPASPISVYLDLGYKLDFFSHHITVEDYEYSYMSTDADGSNYKRLININNLKELQEIETSTVEASLLIKYNYKKFNFVLGAGLGDLTIDKANYFSIATVKYSGYYEDFYGLLIEENGVYDFGVYEVEQNGKLGSAKSIQTNFFNFNMEYKLSKRLLANIGVNYQTSNNPYFKRKNTYLSDSYLNLNSIANNIEYTLNYFSTSVGLIIKL